MPGIFSSGTTFHSLSMAVDVAYDPMPSVSKKLAMNPMAVPTGVGVAGPSSPSLRLTEVYQKAW